MKVDRVNVTKPNISKSKPVEASSQKEPKVEKVLSKIFGTDHVKVEKDGSWRDSVIGIKHDRINDILMGTGAAASVAYFALESVLPPQASLALLGVAGISVAIALMR